jgi:hypothetical protein
MEDHMRVALIVFIAGVLLASPAWGSVDVRRGSEDGARPGVSTSVFRVADEFAGVRVFRPAERLSYRGMRLEVPAPAYPAGRSSPVASPPDASWSGRKTAIAVIASAILPGMGELYCYTASRDRWTLARVPVLVALDGYMWYGYFHNHSVGKDYKRDYEEYADAHWSLEKFLKEHPCCNQGVGDSCDSWTYFNQNCQGEANYFFYTPRELDSEEYYENIGKYNAFAFGWDDAEPWDFNNVNEFNEYRYWTPHREYYWSLRKDSDRYLLRSDEYLMGLIVSRVVSMLDTGWLAYRISRGHNPDKGWSLRFKTYDEAPSLIISRRF